MADLTKVTLENVGGGVAPELFQNELKRVLGNIADPNTSTKEARKITMEFTFQPNESRSTSIIQVKCTSKLAGAEPHSVAIHIVKQNGQMVAFGHDPRQLDLMQDPAPVSIVAGGKDSAE